MAWSLVASGGFDLGLQPVTLNTTGADLLVYAVCYFGAPTITDGKSNTWTARTLYQSANRRVLVYYCWTGSTGFSVGSGHTFSITGGSFVQGHVQAWSGSLTSSDPYNAENGANNSNTTIQPGSVSPSTSDDLFITAICANTENPTVSSGGATFTKTSGFANSVGGAMAWATSGSAQNPTWTVSAAAEQAATLLSFKSAGGGGGATNWGPWIVGGNFNRIVQTQ